MFMTHLVHTYAELRQQIHEDLRIQHPEWIEPGGESPMCDFYEDRLMRLLNATGSEPNEFIAGSSRFGFTQRTVVLP
jgi:hypothetical protein